MMFAFARTRIHYLRVSSGPLADLYLCALRPEYVGVGAGVT